MSLIHTYAHQRRHLLHVRGKYDGRLFCSFELRREPGLTQLHLQQGLEPQFCLVLPLHLAGTGVVDGKNIAARQQNARRAGAAYFDGLCAQLLDLPGAVIGGPVQGSQASGRRGGEQRRLFPGQDGHIRIEHRHQHLGHPVKAQAADHFRFKLIGLATAGEVGQKLIRPALQQQPFCGGGQAQAANAIAVECPQEIVPFELLDRVLLVGIRGGEAADQGGGQFTGQSGERQNQARKCVQAGQLPPNCI